MRGRVVATERHADAEQADHQRQEVPDHDQEREEHAEDDHLGDEHALAAEIVREAAERDGADQDAREACRGDQALLGGGEMEFAGDQRHRDAAHEDDEALEELAEGGERPNAPLHARHGRGFERSAVRPYGQFVDIFLNRLGARLSLRFGCDGVGH